MVLGDGLLGILKTSGVAMSRELNLKVWVRSAIGKEAHVLADVIGCQSQNLSVSELVQLVVDDFMFQREASYNVAVVRLVVGASGVIVSREWNLDAWQWWWWRRRRHGSCRWNGWHTRREWWNINWCLPSPQRRKKGWRLFINIHVLGALSYFSHQISSPCGAGRGPKEISAPPTWPRMESAGA
jgi:hypothetical protein